MILLFVTNRGMPIL